MDTIGPYKVISTVPGARRPMFLVSSKDGTRLLIKTAPLANLNPEERERFEREASICSTLDHPNLVRVVDSGQTPEFLYQVMPYLEGFDLNHIFGSGRQFTWEGKLSVMDGVCDGLAYAHNRKLVHRDIKPANLFLENNGTVRILDFGMVRMDSSNLTRVGAAVGTLNYMAPEQVRGEPCTAASDVFAVGIVFYQLCTGVHPFAGGKKSLPEILSAILFDAPPAWTVTGAPEGLEFVIRRAMEKDPAKRWRSASELRQALSLCRFTLENSGPENRAAAQTVSGASVEADPQTYDGEKTVVIRRTSPPPVVAAPPPPPEPPPEVRQPSPPVPKHDARVCTACTYSNSKYAINCARCNRPLHVPGPPVTPSTPIWRNWVWVSIAVVVLLAVIAVIVAVVMS